MGHARLPIDVEEAHLAVMRPPGSINAAWREIARPAGAQLHALKPWVELRRQRLCEYTSSLPSVFERVQQRRLPPVHLEASRHVSGEARGIVEAHEQRQGMTGRLQLQLLPAVDSDPWVMALSATELGQLEVHRSRSGLWHDAPNIEVGEARCWRDDGREPGRQGLMRSGNPRTFAQGPHAIAWVLPAPTQCMGEVVRAAQGQLRHGGQRHRELLVRHDEAVP
mmetsp:Transcript_124628/g.360537  ORF Transcript_124628/g.360537 Transcript_124628/m.360537 type:complete len:223 (+) Transcript_124628:736-1404(+)